MRSLYFITCALLITVCTVNAFPCTHWRNCSYMGCGLNNPNSDYDDCKDGRCIWQCAEAHGLSDSPLCFHDCPEPPITSTQEPPTTSTPTSPSSTPLPYPSTSCSSLADCNYTGCGWDNPNPSVTFFSCVDYQCQWTCAARATFTLAHTFALLHRHPRLLRRLLLVPRFYFKVVPPLQIAITRAAAGFFNKNIRLLRLSMPMVMLRNPHLERLFHLRTHLPTSTSLDNSDSSVFNPPSIPPNILFQFCRLQLHGLRLG